MTKQVKIFLLLIFQLLSSCCDKYMETTYTYKDAIIKRIDKCGRTVFYYKDINSNAGRIWAEYSGLNDGFSGYLKFEENGKVYLLSGDGYFQSWKLDTLKFEFKRLLGHQNLVLDSSVYQIQLSTRYEKERNLNTDSKVEVIYGGNKDK